ncbi:hypothetical protein MIR68_005673 [Amoeboaphelidium protococcarum]|nr:hypothetical protein MIR68_005673 [Amoeboaphelidium protococcarum]
MLQLDLRSRQKFTSSQLQKRVFSYLTETMDKKIRDFMGRFNAQWGSIFSKFGEDSVSFVIFVKQPDTLHLNFTMFQQIGPVLLLHKFVHMKQSALEEMLLCRLEGVHAILKFFYQSLKAMVLVLRKVPNSLQFVITMFVFCVLQQLFGNICNFLD